MFQSGEIAKKRESTRFNMTIAVPVYFIMAVYFIPLDRVCPSKYIVGANVAFDKG